jgi:hypothetical protein
MYIFSCSTSQLTHLLSVLSSRPKSSYDIATLHLMPIRNPSIEENTHRQRGAKLVFDGVELPRVHRIPSRKTGSEGDKDANGADENMEIGNSNNSGATRSFYMPSGSNDNVTGTPTERNATRGRRIAKQRKGVTGNIPATSRDLELEQPFGRESNFSRCTSPSLLYRRVNVRSEHML